MKRSLQFPLYNAMWQIAELIGRKNNSNFEKYLLLFINDKNKYVRRRALLSLARIVPEKAEEIAMLNVNDEDYYLRMVSLKILTQVQVAILKLTMDYSLEHVRIKTDQHKNGIYHINHINTLHNGLKNWIKDFKCNENKKSAFR